MQIDTSLKTFLNFGIQDRTSMAAVQRLACNGATSGRYFEFPELHVDRNQTAYCDQDFVTKMISKIEACVGVGVYSLKLTYTDGTESPLFGHRQPNMEDPIRIDPDTDLPHEVRAVSIQAWGQNYVQAITLMGGINRRDMLAQLTASKGKG